MANKICEISIGRGTLDDDYSIYDDGKVIRSYDQNTFKLNLEETLEVSTLSNHIKDKLISKCSAEFKVEITKVLYPENK